MFKVSLEGVLLAFLGSLVCIFASAYASMPEITRGARAPVLVYVLKDHCSLNDTRSLEDDRCVFAVYGVSDARVFKRGNHYGVSINNSPYSFLTHHEFTFENASQAKQAATVLNGKSFHVIALHRDPPGRKLKMIQGNQVALLNEMTGVLGTLASVAYPQVLSE